jgi:uncharacterized membrane protein
MESNNIPQYGAATKPAPSLSSNPSNAPSPAAKPGKPPKLYTRLRMATLTAPQVIAETSRRDDAPRFLVRQRIMAAGIVLLIAVVIALSVVIKLVQTSVKNEKSSKLAAMEQREKLKVFSAALEKEKEVLNTRVADLEQKWKISAQLQADLARERQLSTEAKAGLQQATAAKSAAEKERADMQAQVVTQSKRVTDVMVAMDQIQQELAREKQSRTESEAEIAKANQAHMVLAQAMVGLKQKLAEAEKQAQVLKNKGEFLAQRQTELARERQFSTEAEAGLRQATAFEQFHADRGMSPSGADAAKAAGGFLSAGSEANRHFRAGIQKWGEGNANGSIAEFNKTISLDGSAAVAYYNAALGYVEKGDRYKACDYLYQAGEIFLENKNEKQAARVVELMKVIDPSSDLTAKLRKKIAKK